MNPEKATHCKEIRKILKEALHGNKDLNLYLESGGKHAKLTDGAYSLTIPSSPSDRKSVKNFEKELTEFVKKLRENRITHEAHELGILYRLGCVKMILGIDEAGRGCLAGSLFVAGVVCNEKTALEFLEMGLKDSKKLSLKKRFFLEDKIKTHDEVGFFVVKKSAEAIDNLGLGACLKLAIEEIVENGCSLADEIKIDGNTAFGLDKRYPNIQTIIKGDETIAQIAMASVLAKAAKDREMLKLHALFKEYGWDKNRGYGTKQHIEAMIKLGATPFHRHSFTLKNHSLFQTKPLDVEQRLV